MSKRILTLDIGASTLKLAEFKLIKDGSLELVTYGIKPVGVDPADEANRMVYTGTALQELVRELQIKPGAVQLSLSGTHVFSRYVKLPPVSGDKISQVVEYEAKQNIPNLNEVVWDLQILPGQEGDMDVLLAAVKQQVVEELAETVHEAGLDVELVDVSVAALYNATRMAYPEMEECAMILDMGAKTTNLVFVEGNQVWSRSFPVSGNSITQSIANDFDLTFGEAEALKEEVSMVALGGAFEPLEDQRADQVSKCIRSSMTRLHAEIHRSINTYRSQQHGSMPTQVYLTGGSVMMSYFDLFLQEKLELPFEYLNPLASVTLGPGVDQDQINADWHLLSEVVGLAQRQAGNGRMQMNLLPPSIARERYFQKKQGVLVACMITLAATLGVWGLFSSLKASHSRNTLEEVKGQVDELSQWSQRIAQEKNQFLDVEKDLLALTNVVAQREVWIKGLQGVRELLPEHVWITQVTPDPVTPDTKLVMIGSFFKDRLYEDTRLPDNQPIVEFVDAMKNSELFSEDTQFALSIKDLSEGARDQRQSVAVFQLDIILSTPVDL